MNISNSISVFVNISNGISVLMMMVMVMPCDECEERGDEEDRVGRRERYQQLRKIFLQLL